MDVALDAYFSPIFMKKNRPAYKLSVIYKEEDEEKIADIIFKETTSIGLRIFNLERRTLDRKIIKKNIGGRDYYVKQVSHKDKIYLYPEYESAKNLAKDKDISLKEAFDLLKLTKNN